MLFEPQEKECLTRKKGMNQGASFNIPPVLTVNYVSWAWRARRFQVFDIDPDCVTNINYAFANVKGDGEVIYGNIGMDLQYTGFTPWNDDVVCNKEKIMEEPPWEDNTKPIEIVPASEFGTLKASGKDSDRICTSNILQGNLGALFEYKRRNRHVKTFLVVGGYSWSKSFPIVCKDPQKIKRFVDSLMVILNDCGFDGVDIDWEYPGINSDGGEGDASDAIGYVSLVKELRKAITEQSLQETGEPAFSISISSPCTSWTLSKFPLKDLGPLVDHFNIMCYDLSGGWSDKTWHHAPLYGTKEHSDCIESAISYYTSQGIESKKMVVGVPMYGRTFGNTDGSLDSLFKGPGPVLSKDNPEPGTVCIMELSMKEPEFVHYPKHGASTTYKKEMATLISHDSPESIIQKAEYILEKGLGGAMVWESSQDYQNNQRCDFEDGSTGKTDDRKTSLVKILAKKLWNNRKAFGLRIQKNRLYYPKSRFINVFCAGNQRL
jgi:chitinase